MEQDLASIESALGVAIPSSLREVLLNHSRRVAFHWSLPDEVVDELPSEVDSIYSGQLDWSTESLVSLNKHKDDLVETFAPDPSDSFDALWHNKFAFASSPGGDIFAISNTGEADQRVAYLSKSDNPGHGYFLADDFKDFLQRFSRLGCPGSEGFQWLPFAKDPDSMLDPESDNAKLWRDAIGLQV